MQKVWIAALLAAILAAASYVGAVLKPSILPFLGGNVMALGEIDVSSATPAPLAGSSMTPGDKVTGALRVTNTSSVPIRYAMRTATMGSTLVTDALQLTVKSGVTACTDAGFISDGSEMYAGPLTAGTIGDASPGSQAGDRNLNVSASETLCFQVQLAESAPDTAQEMTSGATFTFIAEQYS